MNPSVGSDDDHIVADANPLDMPEHVFTTPILNEADPECCIPNCQYCENDVPHPSQIKTQNIQTKEELPHCYGTIPQSNSPYFRCDIETNPEQVCLMLFGVWNMTVPGLIMRMIGDIDTTPSVKVEKELLQGIFDAAVASDAWIITNGYKEESIAELIGEVVYNCQMKNGAISFNAIAVGKWGNIRDFHKNVTDQSTTNKNHGRYKLELNHTQYIFFDDGTCDTLDTGDFAANLARQISSGARRRIPLVTVLVGGTLHSFSSISTDLAKLIPIVIIPGCGPLGDLLYKYLKITEGLSKEWKSAKEKPTNENETFSDDEDDIDLAMADEPLSFLDGKTLREHLRPLGKHRLPFVNDVRQLYNIMRQQEYEDQGKRLPVGELLTLDEEETLVRYLCEAMRCLQDPVRESIHVFNINSSKSLKETIYYAFIQARDKLSQTKKKFHTTIDEEVQMALRWSISDIIEQQSVTIAKIWNDNNKITQNRSLLIDALSKNLLLFVMNFVKLDIDFMTLFGPADPSSTRVDTSWPLKYHYLKELYSDATRRNPDPLYLLDRIHPELNYTRKEHVVILLKELVGDFMHPLYADSTNNVSISSKTEEEDAEYIHRDLFLWCVLTYRLDMAKIFLSQMKTRICSALIASKILKSLAVYAPDHVAKDTLVSKAAEFETHAIEFVRCAYSNDKIQACELIMRRIDLYEGVTCLQVAIAADNKKFIYEDACRALLTNIWYDKVDPVVEQNRLMINMVTMGVAELFISFYQKHSHKYSPIKQIDTINTSTKHNRRLKKHGIDYTDDYGIDKAALKHFSHFHNRPVVKYCYTCIGYALFLSFFSYFMLYAFVPISSSGFKMHWTEILTIITVTTMLFEELRQDDRSLLGKLRTYFDLNNRISNLCLVLPSYLLFYIGLILRFTQKDADSFVSARVVMAIDLELWFICSVLLIGIFSNLGPKIVMIRKMTSDLSLFIIIIVIFMFGYGITSRSIMAYGTLDFNAHTFLRDVIHPVYYFVHGSFDNERTQLEGTQPNKTAAVTQVMFAFHMLFVNILLLNLLIALFSFTINDVQTQARYIWAYDRCDIIKTYYSRPALFPPLTFLISFLQFCRWSCKTVYRNWCTKKKLPNEPMRCFKMIPMNKNVDHGWSQFERYSTNTYIRQLLDDQATALVKGIPTDVMSESSTASSDEFKHIKTLIGDLQNNLEDSDEQTNVNFDSITSTIDTLQARLDQMDARSDRSRKDMKEVKMALYWMMQAMVNTKMSDSEPPVIQVSSRSNSLTQNQLADTKRSRPTQRSNTGLPSSRKVSQHDEQLSTTESPTRRSSKSDEH